MVDRRARSWGLAALSCAALALTAVGADVPIAWTQIAPLSLPRHSGAAVEAGGLIYLIGGIEYGNKLTVFGQSYDVTSGTLVESLNPATGVWTRLADLPYPVDMMARRAEGRQWPAAASHGGRIYLFGGANLNGVVRDTIDVYDIASDTWTVGIARLPQPICALSAATVGDTVYLFGGGTSVDPYAAQDYVAACYAFDPATLAVTPIAPLPMARFKTTAIPVDGHILVLGGISATASANAQIYDPASDTWTRLEPVFWERRFWGGAEIDGAMFLIGGRDEHALSSGAVDVFVPAYDAWMAGDPMAVPREDAFTLSVGNSLYVIGGRNHEGTPLPAAERGIPDLDAVSYTPAESPTPEWAMEWSEGLPMPTPRYFGASAVLGDRLFTIGGLEGEAPTGQVVEVYDAEAERWETKAPLPEGRFNVPAAELDGIIYVFGGARTSGEVTDTVYAYDPAADAWSLVGRLPSAAAGMTAVSHDGRIYLFGGSRSAQMYVPKENYFSEAYAFDPATFTFEALPPMPVARNMAIGAVVDGDIVVIGGMKSPGATACQRYRPRERTWNIQVEMPTPRGGAVAVLMPSITTPAILVLGGANDIDIYGYDAFHDRWFLVGEIPAPRNMAFTGVVGSEQDRALLVGGVDETGRVVDTVYVGTASEP